LKTRAAFLAADLQRTMPCLASPLNSLFPTVSNGGSHPIPPRRLPASKPPA
jgi:hypothetical protein